ncbi:MAG: hypothetical protein IKZ22_08665, partial [Kiritimatiellae bacterium]|nr:hypothetical protein [Kiritimatiellia bacterium]
MKTLNTLVLVSAALVWASDCGAAVEAVGGSAKIVGNCMVHTFTESGTFTVTEGGKVDVLIVAGGGGGGAARCGGGGGGSSSSPGDGTSITLFNSKNEIQEDFENLAKAYEEETGVHVEVYYSQDTVSAHLATKYASKAPYTINMVDAKDVYSLGKQYGADMSDASWV